MSKVADAFRRRRCLLKPPENVFAYWGSLLFLERFPITQILFHFEFSFWKSETKQCNGNAEDSWLTLHPLQLSKEQ